MWNSFTDQIIVTSHTCWFWAKATFVQAICHKLEKRRADFSHWLRKCNPFQSCPFVSIHAFLPFALFLLCCSTVLSGYCNVSFCFLGILDVTDIKLHHSEGATVCENCENTAEKHSNPSRTYHQLSTLKRNIYLSFGRIFKTCLFPGLFNASGTSPKNL